MKTNHRNRFLAAALLIAGVTLATTRAAELYWDANGDATTATGGGGGWATANTWRDGSSTGTLGDWVNDNTAVFGGTAGTVTLGASVSVAQIKFTTTGYTLGSTGDTTNTISFSGTYDDTNPAIDSSTILNASINAKLTGALTGGMVITNGNSLTSPTGRVNLGNAANDFVGDITLRSGIVHPGSAFGAAANKIIFAGGALNGAASATATHTINRDLVVDAAGYIRVATTSGTYTVNLGGAITGNANLTLSSTGSAAEVFNVTGNLSGFNGILDAAADRVNIQTTAAHSHAGKWLVSSGTLTFANADALYGGVEASWTKENITVKSGGTLAFDTAGFSSAQIASLIDELKTSIDNNGLLAGSNIGLVVAPGNTVAPVITDSTGTGGGSVGLHMSGGGNLTLANPNFSGGLNITGGVTTVSGASTQIGGSPAASIFANGNATLRHGAGTLSAIDTATPPTSGSGGIVSFGIGTSGYGAYELSDGTLKVVNPWRFTGRNAMITQTGGLLDVTYNGGTGTSNLNNGRVFIIGETANRGIVYATGGQATFATSNVGTGQAAVIVSDTTTAAGAELTLAGTAEWTLSGPAGFIAFTRSGGRIGHLNLNDDAVLTTNKIAAGSGGTTRLNFDGGTLRAGENNTAFLTGLTSARIYANGAKIDTNGHNVTVGQNISNPTGDVVTTIPVTAGGSGYTGAPIVSITGGGGSGASAVADYDKDTGEVTGVTLTSPGSDYTSAPTVTLAGGNGSGATLDTPTLAAAVPGALTKTGAGTLTLSGTSDLTGATIVEEGTLALTGSLLDSPITVKSGAAFQPGPAQDVKSLTMEDGSRLLAPFSAGSDYLIVNDGISLPGGAVKIVPSFDGPPELGTFTVLEGVITGPGTINADFNTNGPSRVGSTTTVTAGNTVEVEVTSVGADLVWNNAAGTGLWDLNTSANFLNGGANDVFLIYDRVTFGPSSPGGTVTIAGDLLPAAVEVNSAADFILVGTGSLGGDFSLTKDGTGTLTIDNTNTIIGETLATDGTLVVNGALGSGPVFVETGATLAGSGTVAGTVNIDFESTVSPGASIGTLATGPLTLAGTYHCEIDGADSDRIAVTGNLSLADAILDVDFVNPPVGAPHLIATCTGTRSGTFDPASVPTGYELDYTVPSQVLLWPALVPPTDGTITFETDQGYPTAPGDIATATSDPLGAPYTGINGWSLSVAGATGRTQATSSSGEYRGGQAIGAADTGTFTSGKLGSIAVTGANTITFDAPFASGMQVGLFKDADHDGLFEATETGMSFGTGGTPTFNFFYRNAGFGDPFGAPVTGTLNHWYRYSITIGESVGGERAITLALRNLTTATDVDFDAETEGVQPWSFTVTDAQFGIAPELADGIFIRTTATARIDNLRITSVAPPPTGTYAGWANLNGVTGGMDDDDDLDGVANGIEFFMGDTSNGFTAMPAPDGTRTITWTKGAAYNGAYGTDFVVETSPDLDAWTPVPALEVDDSPTGVSYTLPAGEGTIFARLKVMGPQ